MTLCLQQEAFDGTGLRLRSRDTRQLGSCGKRNAEMPPHRVSAWGLGQNEHTQLLDTAVASQRRVRLEELDRARFAASSSAQPAAVTAEMRTMSADAHGAQAALEALQQPEEVADAQVLVLDTPAPPTRAGALDSCTPPRPVHLRHYSHTFIAQPRGHETAWPPPDVVLSPALPWLPPNALPQNIAAGVPMKDSDYKVMMAQLAQLHDTAEQSQRARLIQLATVRDAELRRLQQLQAKREALQTHARQVWPAEVSSAHKRWCAVTRTWIAWTTEMPRQLSQQKPETCLIVQELIVGIKPSYTSTADTFTQLLAERGDS